MAFFNCTGDEGLSKQNGLKDSEISLLEILYQKYYT